MQYKLNYKMLKLTGINIIWLYSTDEILLYIYYFILYVHSVISDAWIRIQWQVKIMITDLYKLKKVWYMSR